MTGFSALEGTMKLNVDGGLFNDYGLISRLCKTNIYSFSGWRLLKVGALQHLL